MKSTKDTIAAITTAPGDAAISAIRISGQDATLIANKIFSCNVEKIASHTAKYGKILSKEGLSLDHVLMLVMRAPKSYTGEDTVEIFCHGGRVGTQKILARILQAGARNAGPGEFSLRAFLNGKIDLAQAEAIQGLIHAQNDLSLTAAESHLEGILSKRIHSFQKNLTDIAAILEAWVDFPEEGLEFASQEEIVNQLTLIQDQIRQLTETFHDGKIMKEGISLSLIGIPNVGKSSLMNALLGKDRAIVTDEAGTTRDIIEEDLKIGQLHFRLIDTAGIRKTDKLIEKEGIKRSKEALKKADLVLFVMSANDEETAEERELLTLTDPKKTLLIWNKIDLKAPKRAYDFPFTAHISAKNHLGIDELKKTIDKMIWKKGPPEKGQLLITEMRHKQALERALTHIDTVKKGLLDALSCELISEEMKSALHALSEIIGTNVSEDILSSIFSKFCVGK